MKKDFKKNEGITLVALVVTIIVLIILAGISINLLLGENGIVTKAKAGAENYQIAANEETGLLSGIVNTIDLNISGKTGELTLSETEGNYKSNETKTFEITNNESGGELTVETDAPEVATASISGNTVTVIAGTTAGEATITVKSAAAGDYKEQIITYTAIVENGTITLSATPYNGVYDGQPHNALTNVTVEPSDCTLEYKLGTDDYTSEMPQVTGVISFTITVKATKEGYTPQIITETVTVEQANAGNFTVTLPYSSTNYTGSAITPAPIVKQGSTTLTANTDYTVSYSNNTNAGTATVIVTGKGNYTGTKTATFTINKMSVTIPTLTNTTKEYTGSSQSPTINNYNSTYVTQSGTTSAINKGTYTITWTLKNTTNYKWSDGTTTNKSATWKIVRTTLQVGDVVSYNPSGTYYWNAEYATSYDTGSTAYTNANQTLSSASGQSFNVSSWKVLSINGTTVEMVPTAQTTGAVTLGGAQGYNNAVKLLNDACSSLYSNSSKGITARSIKIEDIEKIITKNGYNPATYTNDDVYYGSQAASAYIKICSYYPSIYAQEKNSVINGSRKTSGLGLSEQTSLISKTASGATNGYLQASTSIQPYGTSYSLENSAFSNYLGTTYKDIILPRGTSTSYFVASRDLLAGPVLCTFNVRAVGSGDLSGVGMFGSYYSPEINGYGSRELFPVVSLSSGVISGNDVDGFRVN